MKAILRDAAGALQISDIEKPALPSEHHLLVRLAAAGVNPMDVKPRAPYLRDAAIPGCDGAGIIVATGRKVTRFRIGDAVYFCNGGLGSEPGCYAEYTTLHEDYCARSPCNIPLQDAAALPLVCITGRNALKERANIERGQTVLIHDAAGGAGHVALQMAHSMGARIAVTVGDERKAGLVHALGAEKIILHKEQDFVEEAMKWTDGRGVDVVYDTMGGATFLRSMNAACIGGSIVTLLSPSPEGAELARLRNLSIFFEMMPPPDIMNLHEERIRQRKILEECARQIKAGELGVLVSHRLPLEEAEEAHRLIEAGGVMGKIILTMD